jgi:L-ascorbate metabolism protein UlaG (beta-lactamase superfamily)
MEVRDEERPAGFGRSRLKLRRIVGITVVAGLGAAVAALARSTDWFASLGGTLSGDRLSRARRSPQWSDDRFRNSEPTRTILPGGVATMLRQQVFGDQVRYPRHPIPVEARTRADFETPPGSGLRATWMGHASVLVEIDGLRVLTDPVWSERVSPSTLAGPKRFFQPPIALAELPQIDAVVISHDHYDHLNMETVEALAARGALFLVPLGVGAHLQKWGIAATQVRELDWNEQASLGGVTFTAAPSRHFSGRGVTDRNATLWSSWVIAGPRHRVFFCGDSGFFGGFREIGRVHGPFDLALMSSGAYSPSWPLIHMTPEQVVQAHIDVGGRLLLPIHWGTFNLAFHDWNEPAVRAAAEAVQRGVPIVIPRPGEMVEPSRVSERRQDDWWRER